MLKKTLCFLSVASLVALGCSDDAETTTTSGAGAASSTSAGGSGGAGAQGGSADTVTFTTYIGETQGDLVFVAAQDGDGAWEPLTGSDGSYTFESSGRFGIAYVCVEPGSTGITAVFVVQATTADFTTLVRGCPAPPPASTSNVSGTLSGLGLNDSARVNIATQSTADVTTNYQLTVPSGTWDVFALRNVGGTQGVTDRIIVRRDVAFAGADVTESFNFTTEGEAAELRPMTVENTSTDDLIVMNSFIRSGDGGTIPLFAQNPELAVVPSALGDDETHQINCFASNAARGGLRSAATFAKNPPTTGVAFTLLDPLTATFAVASTSPLVFQASFSAIPEAQSYGLSIGQNTTARRLFVALTAGWLGADLEYTTPDLSGLAGWDPGWELSLGEETAWFAGAQERSTGLDLDDDVTPGVDPALEGAVTRSTTRGGSVTP